MNIIRSAISRLSCVHHIRTYIFFFALAVSLIFTFIVFPKVSGDLHLVLDPDQHGNLGFGLWRYHSFSYYPEREPTTERGPGYPMFIALLLMVTNGWYPQSVQIAQCFVFAIVVILVFYIGENLWDKKVAVVSSVLSAIHPLLWWYTSRIWIEITAIGLFTCMVAGVVYFNKRPSFWKAVVLGVAIGTSALWKSTFFPYAFLVPFLMAVLIPNRQKLGLVFTVMLVAVLVVLPWTIRNWKLTGTFIPVHSRLGFNLRVGDDLVDNIRKSPLALTPIFDLSMERIRAVYSSLPPNMKRYEGELELDSILTKRCLNRYRTHPGFLIKKVLVNSWLFWSLGETPAKTIVISSLLIPMAILFFLFSFVLLKRKQLQGVLGVHVLMVVFYYLAHLPIEAIARYSVVLIPTMLVYVVAFLMERFLGQIEPVPRT
jgi:hypothetical protein